MAQTYEAADWPSYKMNWYDPHRQIEPLEREIAVVDEALSRLVEAGVLPHPNYDMERMLAHRAAVREQFDIPWTAISPRVQRLLYAISAIAQPKVLVAVGIFCGNTFVSNAGAAIGPGAVYQARRVVGIEIDPTEAARARRNIEALHTNRPGGTRAEVLAADGVTWLRNTDATIDLLYLDADGGPRGAKSIYHQLLHAGLHALHPGSLVLAHNSVNAAHSMADYLSFVRDPAHFGASVNVILDDQGVEVSLR